MFCKYCGKELTNDSIFCNYCGKKQGNASDRITIRFSIERRPGIYDLEVPSSISILNLKMLIASKCSGDVNGMKSKIVLDNKNEELSINIVKKQNETNIIYEIDNNGALPFKVNDIDHYILKKLLLDEVALEI